MVLKSTEFPHGHDELGREIIDDTPIEVPLKIQKPPSIQEMVKMYIRMDELSQDALRQELETFEEADDFDVDDDDMPLSGYEMQEMQEMFLPDQSEVEDTPTPVGDKKGVVDTATGSSGDDVEDNGGPGADPKK